MSSESPNGIDYSRFRPLGYPVRHRRKIPFQPMLSNSSTYYDLLAYTDSTGVYTQLVMYIAEALLRAYGEAVKEFGKKDRLAEMDENTRVLVRKAKEVKSFTFSEALTWIPGIGPRTLRADLDRLAEMDILDRQGNTRSMRYMFKDPLRELRLDLENRQYYGS